jgi:hypothetical protein
LVDRHLGDDGFVICFSLFAVGNKWEEETSLRCQYKKTQGTVSESASYSSRVRTVEHTLGSTLVKQEAERKKEVSRDAEASCRRNGKESEELAPAGNDGGFE